LSTGIARKIGFSITATALCLIALETFLRVWYFQRNVDALTAVSHYIGSVREKGFDLKRFLNPDGRQTAPIGIWEHHALFGYDHIPDVSGVHHHPGGDFSVRYTIDSLRCRRTPDPADPRGELLFIGDSFPFGFGVEEEEAFPSLIGERFPGMKIRNRSVFGWGTAQAFPALKAWSRRADAVFYFMIPHTIQRNYLRRDWLSHLPVGAESRRDHPHWEISEGRLVHCGVAGIEAGLAESDYLISKERELTSHFLTEMNRYALESGVPFAVVLLPTKTSLAFPDWLFDHLESQGILCLDLSDRFVPDGFPHDTHYNREDHRAAAGLIGDWVLFRAAAFPFARQDGREEDAGQQQGAELLEPSDGFRVTLDPLHQDLGGQHAVQQPARSQ